MNTRSKLFRFLSLFLAWTLLFQQILFAVDPSPIQTNQNNPTFVPMDRAQESKDRQQALVDKLNDYMNWKASSVSSAAQDDQPAEFRVTTAAGDIITYSGGKIERVQQKDLTVIDKIEFSAEDTISNAVVTYADGTMLLIENGAVRGSLNPAGITTNYRQDGLIESQVAKDGSVSLYSYEFDGTNNLTKTLIISASSIAGYDENSRLKQVTKLDGSTIDYEDGLISSITNSSGAVYLFTKTEKDAFIEVRPVTYTASDGLKVAFGDNAKVISITLASGLITKYSAEGKLLSTQKEGLLISYDSQGRFSELVKGNSYLTYSYEVNASGVLENTIITDCGGYAAKYDKFGNLFVIERDGLDVTEESRDRFCRNLSGYDYTEGALNVDLAAIKEALLDDAGFSKTLYYSTGAIKDIFSLDGSVISYTEDGLFSSLQRADGKKIDYSYLTGLPGRQAGALNGVAGVEIKEDGLKRVYDLSGNIKTVQTEDNSKIEYSGNEVSSIATSDGLNRLYKAGKLSELIAEDGAKFTLLRQGSEGQALSPEGKITKAEDLYGNTYEYTYYIDKEDLKEVTVINDITQGITKFYKDNLLFHTEDTTGLSSDNVYFKDGRLKEVTLKKYDRLISSYEYSYLADQTTVSDMSGNTRTYLKDDRLYSLLDKDGNLYRYSYPNSITTRVQLIQAKKGSDTINYDEDGAIESVLDSEGSVYSNIVFGDDKELKSLRVVLSDGKIENIRFFSDVININVKDPSQSVDELSFLIKGSAIIAIATSQGSGIFIGKEEFNAICGVLPADLSKRYSSLGSYQSSRITDRPWAPQTYYNTRAISSITKDYANDTLVLNTNLIAGDAYKSQGEIMLDLNPAPSDLTGKEISFLVKIPEGLLPSDRKPMQVQVFAKDNYWRSQYGVPVSIAKDTEWYRVSLRPTSKEVETGSKNYDFDPSKVMMIGLRLFVTSDSSIVYNAPLLVKDGFELSLPENISYVDSPLLMKLPKLNSYLNTLSGAVSFTGEKNFLSGEDVANACSSDDPIDISNINFNSLYWRTQKYSDSKAITTVSKDVVENQWKIAADFNSSVSGHYNGETLLDLRYDLPGFVYEGPLNLEGKSLKFKIKAPQGFAGASSFAQVFVKNENYACQYGQCFYITKAETWYEITLTPKRDYLAGGWTSSGFDPTKIVQIGIKLYKGNSSSNPFNGNILLKHNLQSDLFNSSSNDVYVDIKSLASYAAEEGIPIPVSSELDNDNQHARNFTNYILSEETILGQEFVNNRLRSVWKVDNTTTAFTYSGKIDYIADNQGRITTDYRYDDSDYLIDIDMTLARRDLNKASSEANLKLSEEKFIALSELARQRGVAVDEIYASAASELNSLISQRNQLQNQFNELNNKKVWPWQKAEKSRQLDEICRMIDQVNQAIAQVYTQLSSACEALDVQVAELSIQIDNQAASSLNEIKEQENVLLSQIIRQEATTFLLYYFRAILGRDPDMDEINSYLLNLSSDHQKLTKQEILESILASTEYNARKTEVDSIKTDVKNSLNTFLSLTTQQEKDAFLSNLGLTQEEIVQLNQNDIDVILKWLDSQSLHFGHSAFLALKSVLSHNGITSDFEELAANVILIDILTGATDVFTTGDLTLSMFALSRYARTKGLNLYNTKLSFDDLRTTIDELRTTNDDGLTTNDEVRTTNDERRIIVHVNGNHYITITNIEDDKIYYREENKGPSGTDEVISKEEFLKIWSIPDSAVDNPQGYCITQLKPQDEAKILSDTEAKQIKGAFLPVLAALFAWLAEALAGIISGIVAAVTTIIATVSAVVATALAAVTSIISTIAAQIVSGITAAFSGITAAFSGITAGFSAGSLIASALKTTAAIALNLGITSGLQALGVNSTISKLTSSFLTGGILGIINPASSSSSLISSFMSEGFKYSTIEGLNQIGNRVGLNPSITNILAITAGSLTDGLWQGNIGETAVSIAPNVASEFAYYGITELGEKLGVDPRISQIAGIGIRSSLNAGLVSGGNPQAIWQGIKQGLSQGVVSVGLNYATEKTGLSPLLSNLGFSVISSALNAGIQSAIGEVDPLTGERPDVFKSIFNTYKDNALTFLGYSSTPNREDFYNQDGSFDQSSYDRAWGNYKWQQASYTASILNFTDIVEEVGLSDALNTYGESFFNSTAVNSILQSGLTMGQYFKDKLDKKEYTIKTTQDGKQLAEVTIEDPAGDKVSSALFEEKSDNGSTFWDLAGKEDIIEGDILLGYGKLAVDQNGRLGYTDAELYSNFGSYEEFQRLEQGQQAYVEIKDSEGKTLLVVTPGEGSRYNLYNSYGEWVEAKVDDVMNNRGYSFKDLRLNYYEEFNETGVASLVDIDLTNPDAINLIFNSFSATYDEINQLNLTVKEKRQILNVLLLNGIGNPNPEGQSPAYMGGFAQQLALADPDAIQTTYITTYENSAGLSGKIRNGATWFKDVYLSSDEITDDILNEIDRRFNGNPPADMVALAYSGDGDPLLQALNKRPNLDVKSAVLIGAPLRYGRKITNSNVENVIMIGGSQDFVCEAGGGAPFQNFEGSANQINTYKIVLNGIDHCNYTYDPNETNPDPIAVQSARFIAKMVSLSNDPVRLDDFLLRNAGISYYTALGVYAVNLNEVTYDE
ncbi:MAG: hypothetical protein V1933_01965 [Candidatus Omnitrophota bacterium]